MKITNWLTLAVILGVGGYIAFQQIRGGNIPLGVTTYTNSTYGYTFVLPLGYEVLKNSEESFTIKKTGIADPVGMVSIHAISDTVGFSEAVHGVVQTVLCPDLENGATCTDIVRSVPLSAKSGLTGELFTMNQVTVTSSTTATSTLTTTTTKEVGPFLAFHISSESDKNPHVFILHVQNPSSTDAGLIEAIIETLRVPALSGNIATTTTLVTKIGERMLGGNVAITPLKIVEDSRCPIDVTCIQAGTVRVEALLQSGLGTATTTFMLGSPVTTEAESVVLSEVMPAPRSKVKINSNEYRFTFLVSPR